MWSFSSSSSSRRGSRWSAAALLLAAGTAHAEPLAPPAPAPPSAPVPAPAPGAWCERDPIPPGYHSARRYGTGLVAGGASLFVLPYLASGIAASAGYATSAATQSGRGVLWVPAAGPFIMLGEPGTSRAMGALLVLDGLAQVGGLTMLVYGLATPARILVKDEPETTPARVSLAPLVTRGASGLVLTGTF